MQNPAPRRKASPALIIAIAIALLAALSLLPWSKMTGGKVSDFNLVSDLFESAGEPQDTTARPEEDLDPELQAQESQQTTETPQSNSTASAGTSAATASADSAAQAAPALPEASPRRGGDMVIEDYTAAQQGPAHLRAALASASSRPARIAVIGDSYIEGDIFTQDLRDALQSQYGGRGVGYVGADSEVKGFRRSVNHSASGWKEHSIFREKNHEYPLQGKFHTGSAGAKATYTASSRYAGTQGWSRSRVMFIAPASGTITLTTDGGEQIFDVAADAGKVQCVELPGATTKLTVSSTVPGLKMLGAWLDDKAGVTVDNMSIRGYAGLSHRKIPAAMASQTRQYIDYDMIILEFGINALSEKQKDYSNYRKTMASVARHMKELYPRADIVIMGIGDRGIKLGGQVQSMPTAAAMVAAQRGAARDAGVLFWDTREAMGGEGAVLEWRKQKLVNADYIHLNDKGGKRLAQEFAASLRRAL